MYTTMLSTKGQLVMPAKIRAEDKLKAGTRFVIQRTLKGYEIIPIPKDPIKALCGIAKDLDISPEDIKRMRLKDDAIRRKKLDF